MKTVLILYPHQLFAFENLPEVDTVMMVEEPLYFGVDQESPLRLHRQKIILLRASMRRYAEEVLWPRKIDVDYVELDVFQKTGEVLDRLKKFERIVVFDPVDERLTQRLIVARRERPDVPAIEFLPSPNFYLKDQEVRQYFAERHKQPFSEFYQWQRERFNVLIGDDYKPVGGKWMYDDDIKRTKLPDAAQLPSFGVFGDNQWVADAIKYADEHFPNNPGGTDFIWPTNHHEAQTWLHDFVTHRLQDYGTYADALDNGAAWLYHSALASSLAIGLLHPQQVVAAAVEQYQKGTVSLENTEAFVQRVLGWREFGRGQYLAHATQMRTANPLNHHRKMTSDWYDGTLGIPPYDDVLKKIKDHGYAHGVERSLVIGNLMILCEIDPADMYAWFGEQFVDSLDWSVLPTVYGMNQVVDDTIQKPCIATSNTILQLSHYDRGVWCDVWDGLYWRFVEKHRTLLHKNPHLRPMVQRLDRLDADRKRIIHYRAEDFLARVTR